MSSSSQNQPVPPATAQPSFTPGPWEARTDCGPSLYIAERGKIPHANVFGRTEQPQETTVADARLIAAAPDLHAACQLVLDTMNERPGMGDAWYAPFREAVSAALAKAGVA